MNEFTLKKSSQRWQKITYVSKDFQTCHDGVEWFQKEHFHEIWRNLWTLPTAQIIRDKNEQAWVSMVSYLKNKQELRYLKEKKSWEPFRICLLNSIANLANVHPNWTGLVVLFSRQILNGSQFFFLNSVNPEIFLPLCACCSRVKIWTPTELWKNGDTYWDKMKNNIFQKLISSYIFGGHTKFTQFVF